MQIRSIVEGTVPIVSPIRNAVIDFSHMTTSVVAVITDLVRAGERVVGYGFSSIGRYAPSDILRERLIPRLLRAPASALLDEGGDNLDPCKARQVMMANEKPGGHGERSAAVGALDMALWDVVAKVEQEPLYQVLAERYGDGAADPRVFVYAAGGYYDSRNDVGPLKDELAAYLAAGYTAVKIKTGGLPLQEDIRRIEAALEVVPDGRSLAVDANARFERAEALRFAEAIAPYGLAWYEEPCDPLDFQTLADVSAAAITPIATGENLFSLADARNLVRYGGLRAERDFLQIDPALSYGLAEYLSMLAMLKTHGWSPQRCLPHGGHLFALHIAAGLGLGGNESYPSVFAPFGGFGDRTHVEKGFVNVPEVPGIGFEQKLDLLALFRSILPKDI